MKVLGQKKYELFKVTIVIFAVLHTIFAQSQNTPWQPEALSYSDMVSTKLVDPLTGDFSYSIPLLSLPSKGGGNVPLVINYNSGVKLTQEATWVGLGWNFNPGMVSRAVSVHPDDFKGEPMVVDIDHDIFHEGDVVFCDLFGQTYLKPQRNPFYARIGGNPVSSAGITRMGYDGLTAGYNLWIEMNTFYFGPFVLQSDPSTYRLGWHGGHTLYRFPFSIKDYMPNLSEYGFKKTTEKEYIKDGWLYDEYTVNTSYSLDVSKLERCYGFLYQSNVPTLPYKTGAVYTSPSNDGFDPNGYMNTFRGMWRKTTIDNFGSSSDMFQEKKEEEIQDNIDPVFMTSDGYTVMAPGISGGIMPIRFDNSSVSYPVVDNESEKDRLKNYKYKVSDSQTSKVQFIYSNDISNTYINHAPYDQVDPINYTYSRYVNDDCHLMSGSCCEYENDIIRYADVFNYLNPGLNPYPTNGQSGFKNGKLKRSKYIEWFTNSEISDGTATSQGFMDFKPVRSRNSSSFPSEGIGGFYIVSESGISYHFALPVYQKTTETITTRNVENNDYSSHVTNDNPVALGWMLTAITGPDFVDNGNGYIDENDMGFYVQYDYGMLTDNYVWRAPYSGTYYSKDDPKTRYSQVGEKQVYYLNKISTNSHVALFVKDYRYDGKSNEGAASTYLNGPYYSSLRLNEVILLEKDKYNYLVNQLGLSYGSNDPNNQHIVHDNHNVLLSYDIQTSALRNYIRSNQLLRVEFNYDYSLCQNTQNSYSIQYTSPNYYNTGEKTGKLTLKGLSYYGKNDAVVQPNFLFEYNNNPDHNRNSWDAWGYYKYASAEGGDKFGTQEGTAWNLSKIIMPLGGEIEIKYSRDEYHYINEHELIHDSENSNCFGTYPIMSDANGNVQYLGEICFDVEDDAEVGPYSILGGDVRVDEIVLHNGTNTNYISYNYHNSGVCTQEPEFAKSYTGFDDYYAIYGAPSPAVVYGHTSVTYSGSDVAAEDRTMDYTFRTPTTGLIEVEDQNTSGIVTVEDVKYDRNMCDNGSVLPPSYGSTLSTHQYFIKYKLDQIGQPITTKLLNSSRDLISETEYIFRDNNNLGDLTQGCNLADMTYLNGSAYDNRTKYRLINTVYKVSPQRLYQTINRSGNDISIEELKNYDTYTGIPSIKSITNNQGVEHIQETLFAHEVNGSMGSKFDNINNKNMLTQPASVTTLRNEEVINTSVHTWKGNWNNFYAWNGNCLVESTANSDNNNWRQYQSFIWQGPLNPDGSYDDSFPTNDEIQTNWGNYFVDQTEPNWIKTDQVAKYNHNSVPLESTNINGDYSAVKMDQNNEYVIIKASNAQYSQITHCTFEHGSYSSSTHQGECGSYIQHVNNVTSAQAHTGSNSLMILGGQTATLYYVASSEFQKWDWDNSPVVLKVSVWTTNSSKCTIAGPGEQLDMSGFQAGSWAQVNKKFTMNSMPTASTISFSIQNTGSQTIYIDDFRISPEGSSVSASVINEYGNEVATLGNSNLARVYSYDAAGRVARTYVEKSTGLELVSTNSYRFGRNYYPLAMWSPTFSHTVPKRWAMGYQATGSFSVDGLPDDYYNKIDYGWSVKNSSGSVIETGSSRSISFTPTLESNYTITYWIESDDDYVEDEDIIEVIDASGSPTTTHFYVPCMDNITDYIGFANVSIDPRIKWTPVCRYIHASDDIDLEFFEANRTPGGGLSIVFKDDVINDLPCGGTRWGTIDLVWQGITLFSSIHVQQPGAGMEGCPDENNCHYVPPKPPPPPPYTGPIITSPTSGSSFKNGDVMTISWDRFTNTVNRSIDLELWVRGGTGPMEYVKRIKSIQYADYTKSTTWTVDVDFETHYNLMTFEIRIRDVNGIREQSSSGYIVITE